MSRHAPICVPQLGLLHVGGRRRHQSQRNLQVRLFGGGGACRWQRRALGRFCKGAGHRRRRPPTWLAETATLVMMAVVPVVMMAVVPVVMPVVMPVELLMARRGQWRRRWWRAGCCGPRVA